MGSSAVFTVDLEHAIASTLLPEEWVPKRLWERELPVDDPYDLENMAEVLWRLLAVLDRHKVHGIFYILGWLEYAHKGFAHTIRERGHLIGSHGMWHRHNEREGDESDILARKYIGACPGGYRSPYWDNTRWPGFSGGTWFRILPAGILLSQIRKTGTFWLHPHDLEPDPTDTYWRHKIFIGDPWKKLERILTEVTWDDPTRIHS